MLPAMLPSPPLWVSLVRVFLKSSGKHKKKEKCREKLFLSCSRAPTSPACLMKPCPAAGLSEPGRVAGTRLPFHLVSSWVRLLPSKTAGRWTLLSLHMPRISAELGPGNPAAGIIPRFVNLLISYCSKPTSLLLNSH